MTLHHAVCIVGYAANIADGVSADLTLGAIFLAEVSNAPMHFSVILRQLGLRYTKLYEVVEIAFMIVYSVGRIGIGSVRIWNMVTCDKYNLILKICGLLLLGQSFMFSTKMIQILKKRYQAIMERRKKNVKMHWLVPLSKAELEKLGITSTTKDDKSGL